MAAILLRRRLSAAKLIALNGDLKNQHAPSQYNEIQQLREVKGDFSCNCGRSSVLREKDVCHL